MNLEKINNQIDTRLPKGDMSGILLRDCNWSVTTAGPSPYNNERTELFLLGCNKAMKGNPCKGCFNSTTWNKETALWSHDPIKMAEHINNNAPNKYITIGGGEPTDQIDNLIILCKELKKYDFHIMMYTWRDLLKAMSCNFEYVMPSCIDEANYSYRLDLAIKDLLQYIDIVVDGQYKDEERLYQQELGDGLLSSIGSGNQKVWDIKVYNEQPKLPRNSKYLYGKYMRDLAGLYIKPDTNDLVYITKE